MATNRSLFFSRRLYSLLLGLYPREHRITYGSAMEQLFTDQCREAFHRRGYFGILTTWLSTLPDLVWTSILEHWSSPNSLWDLVSPNPDRRLPWKSTLTVLLPGAVLFVCQLGEMLGTDWYFNIYKRIGYYLMIPVGIVWWRTRRFPIWGLVPLGLVFYGISTISPFTLFYHFNNLINDLPGNLFKELWQHQALFSFTVAITFFVASLFLSIRWIVFHARRISLSRHMAIGLVALGFFLVIYWTYTLLVWFFIVPRSGPGGFDDPTYLNLPADAIFTNPTIWLVFLAALGTIFSRRYGKLAILIPLGFLLPTVLYGMGITDNSGLTYPWQISTIPTVLFWRLLITIVAPLLLVRTLSPQKSSWIVLPPLALAFALRLWVGFFPGFTFDTAHFGETFDAYWFATQIAELLVLPILIFMAALAIYPAKQAEYAIPDKERI